VTTVDFDRCRLQTFFSDSFYPLLLQIISVFFLEICLLPASDCYDVTMKASELFVVDFIFPFVLFLISLLVLWPAMALQGNRKTRGWGLGLLLVWATSERKEHYCYSLILERSSFSEEGRPLTRLHTVFLYTPHTSLLTPHTSQFRCIWVSRMDSMDFAWHGLGMGWNNMDGRTDLRMTPWNLQF